MAGPERRAIFPVVVGAILAATAVSFWLQFRETPASGPDSPEPPTSSPPPALQAQPTPADIRTVDGRNVLAPVLVQKVEPAYPVAARRARMEGHVIIEAIVTEHGEVLSPRILKSTASPMLDRKR